MMQIIYVVIAIALSTVLVFGGINYVHVDAPQRLVVTQILSAQYDAITAAARNYKISNNGVKAESLDAFRGLIPDGVLTTSSKYSKYYTWSYGHDYNKDKSYVCLLVSGKESKDIKKLIYEFVKKKNENESSVDVIERFATFPLAQLPENCRYELKKDELSSLPKSSTTFINNNHTYEEYKEDRTLIVPMPEPIYSFVFEFNY